MKFSISLKTKFSQADFVPLKGTSLKQYQTALLEWKTTGKQHLKRKYTFRDFKTALAFVICVGKIAEKLQHHPNISFTWGEVTLEIFDHKSGRLTPCDFVLAAHISRLK